MAKVKHIALMKFKAGTSDEQVEKVFEDLLDLSESVAGIEDYVAGPNSSPEAMNTGSPHGFIMTFQDTASRDAYLTNPDHDRVKTAVLPHIESVIVFDFEV